MKTQYAVYHCLKGTGNGGGLGNHIDRAEGKEHSYKTADPTKKEDNITWGDCQYRHLPLEQAIEQRIKDGYKGKRKIRNDAVKYVAHIFTGTHEQMMKIFANEESKQEWLYDTLNFACEEFGEDNIVRFDCHLDEKTPHIHCVTVPLTKDGRLSAKEVVGNRKKLIERQDKYAEVVAKHGLQRGISSALTGNKHETAQEYQARLAQKNAVIDDFKPVKTLGFVNKGKTIKKAEKSLKSAKNAITDLSLKVERQEKKLTEITAKYESLKNIFFKALEFKEVADELRKKNKIIHYKNPQHKQEFLKEWREKQERERTQKYREQRENHIKNTTSKGRKI